MKQALVEQFESGNKKRGVKSRDVPGMITCKYPPHAMLWGYQFQQAKEETLMGLTNYASHINMTSYHQTPQIYRSQRHLYHFIYADRLHLIESELKEVTNREALLSFAIRRNAKRSFDVIMSYPIKLNSSHLNAAYQSKNKYYFELIKQHVCPDKAFLKKLAYRHDTLLFHYLKRFRYYVSLYDALVHVCIESGFLKGLMYLLRFHVEWKVAFWSHVNRSEHRSYIIEFLMMNCYVS